MERFYQLEEKAVKVLGENDNRPAAALLADLQQGIRYWQEGASLIKNLDKLNVSSGIHSKNRQLIKYCQLRIKSYQINYYAYQNGTYPDQKQVYTINQQIKEVMTGLSSR